MICGIRFDSGLTCSSRSFGHVSVRLLDISIPVYELGSFTL